MNKLPLFVEKYLKKYSIPGWDLETNPNKKFDNIIVIPAISELENIKILLASLMQNDISCIHKTLIIFVINNLVSSEDKVKQDNIKTIEYFKETLPRQTIR